MLPARHAIARASERYGIEISQEDARQMGRDIYLRRPWTLILGPALRGSELVAIRFRGRWLALAYLDRYVLSVLPDIELLTHRAALDERLADLRRLGIEGPPRCTAGSSCPDRAGCTRHRPGG